jgi:hypothetical protein
VADAGDSHGVHDLVDGVLVESAEGRRGGGGAINDRVEPRGDVRLDETRAARGAG